MSHESIFDWKIFRSPTFGNTSLPVASVEIRSILGEWELFYPEVDSGAIISVFNESDCDLLGLRLEDGQYFEISGVLGGRTPAYIHEVDMRIGRNIIKSKVAFTKGKSHKQLLGRLGVFNNFQILFKGKSLQTHFIKE